MGCITELKKAYRLGVRHKKLEGYAHNPYKSEPGDKTLQRKKWYMYNRGFNKTSGQSYTKYEYEAKAQQELF